MPWKNPVPRWLTRLVMHLVGLGLLGRVLWINRISVGKVFAQKPDGWYLALSFAFCLTALVTTFIRWMIVVRAQGLTLRLRDAIRVGFMGNAIDLVIPGQIGGDVLKATFLGRDQDRKTKAVASVLVDRAIGILGMFTLAALMGAVSWPHVPSPVRRVIVVAWVIWAGLALGLLTVLTPALFRPMERRFAGRRRLGKLLAELHEISVAYRDRKLSVASGLAMSTGSHGFYALAFYAVSLALLPDPPSLLNNMLMAPLVLFSTAIPLPFGALGLSEQVSDDLFRLLGHASGALVMLGLRVVSLGVATVSVGVYLLNSGEFSPERTDRITVDAPPIRINEPSAT